MTCKKCDLDVIPIIGTILIHDPDQVYEAIRNGTWTPHEIAPEGD